MAVTARSPGSLWRHPTPVADRSDECGVQDDAHRVRAYRRRTAWLYWLAVGLITVSGTWEWDAYDVTAVVQGMDGRFPMQPGVASFLRTHHDELEHFTVDELQVWIPEHGSIRERDGVLELDP